MTAVERMRGELRRHLRLVLAANRWSLQEAARRSGVGESTLHRIANGENTSVDTFVRFADGLGYEVHITLLRKP